MDVFLILFLAIWLVIFLVGVVYLIQGPPFVPSDDETTKAIVDEVIKQAGKKVIDVGSGDGKVVLALARAGVDAYGIEINPMLVWRSRRAIRKQGLEHKAIITWGNMWRTDFSSYDIVIIYGIKHVMKKLGEKLEKELPEGSIVITNFFVFPQWKPRTKKKRVLTYEL